SALLKIPLLVSNFEAFNIAMKFLGSKEKEEQLDLFNGKIPDNFNLEMLTHLIRLAHWLDSDPLGKGISAFIEKNGFEKYINPENKDTFAKIIFLSESLREANSGIKPKKDIKKKEPKDRHWQKKILIKFHEYMMFLGYRPDKNSMKLY